MIVCRIRSRALKSNLQFNKTVKPIPEISLISVVTPLIKLKF